MENGRELDVLTGGCRALLLEIVRRAAYDWVLYRTSRRLKNKVLADDAHHWLFEETEDGPESIERKKDGTELCSFLAICSALDLDPGVVRRRVRELTPKDVLSVGRPSTYRKFAPSSDEEESGLPDAESVVSMQDLVSGHEENRVSSDRLFYARPSPLRSWRSKFG